jgi:hypothetical protein
MLQHTAADLQPPIFHWHYQWHTAADPRPFKAWKAWVCGTDRRAHSGLRRRCAVGPGGEQSPGPAVYAAEPSVCSRARRAFLAGLAVQEAGCRRRRAIRVTATGRNVCSESREAVFGRGCCLRLSQAVSGCLRLSHAGLNLQGARRRAHQEETQRTLHADQTNLPEGLQLGRRPVWSHLAERGLGAVRVFKYARAVRVFAEAVRVPA